MSRRTAGSASTSRHLLIITGIAVLLWSGLEDNDAIAVTILGALCAVAAAMKLFSSPVIKLPGGGLPGRATAAGALIGALACLTTPALMLFKDLRHAHAFPDYPPGMMLATLERLPWWGLAGALAGFGIGVLLKLGLDWAQARRRTLF